MGLRSFLEPACAYIGMVEYLGSWSKKAEVLLGDPQMPGSEVLALSAAGFLSRTLACLGEEARLCPAYRLGWGGGPSPWACFCLSCLLIMSWILKPLQNKKLACITKSFLAPQNCCIEVLHGGTEESGEKLGRRFRWAELRIPAL